MRFLLLVFTCLSISALALLGCGREETSSSTTELAPAGAAIYAEFTLAPQGEQKRAIDAILSKFPGGENAGERLEALIEDGLRKSDAPLSYSKDIAPWLGAQGAFFAGGQTRDGELEDAAALLATEDEGKARDALEKAFEGKSTERSYKDVDYLFLRGEQAAAGLVDGYVVIGNRGGFEAVVDTSDGGAPLSEDEAYGEAIADVATDRLGLFYLNSPKLFEATKRSAGQAQLPESLEKVFEEPYVATVSADQGGVTFEAAVPDSLAKAIPFFGQGSDLMAGLPSDSWLAMAQPDLGKLGDYYVDALAGFAGGRDTIEQQFKAVSGLDLKADVLAWMGDFAVFARGTTLAELDGALVVETTDPAATRRFISRLRELAATQSDPGTRIAPLALAGGGEGFTVLATEVPQPIHLFLRGERLVLAYGDAAARDALDPPRTLGDNPDYAQAAASIDGFQASFYLAMGPVFKLVDSTSAGSDRGWQRAQPYLEPLKALVAGSEGDGGDLRSALKLIIE